jgi:hypothetical protein
MIMSHATHKGTRTFTQLNFCIPYQQFSTLINFANGEGTHLKKISKSETEGKRMKTEIVK